MSDHPSSTSASSTKSSPLAKIADPKIVVALDYDNLQQCLAVVERLNPALCRVKVGKELFTACGPHVIEELHLRGFQVFLDLKFHDIPATVAKAVKTAANLGVWMVNVHASGGPRMLIAAREALENFRNKPWLIGVTVLTSMQQDELVDIGINRPLHEQVVHLAGLVKQSGLDGVVCSAQEASALKNSYGRNFILVTPGIRPPGSDADDQRRIVTPQEAVRAGSDYLVVGRPITQAPDPALACGAIAESLSSIHA